MEETKFCTNCGATLSDGEKFCPKCGHNNDPTPESTQQYEANRSRYLAEEYKGKMITIVILCAIWCVFALYLGIELTLSIDSIMGSLKDDTTTWDLLMTYFTEQDLRNMFISMGYVLIASGICAAVSALFTAIKKYYIVALLACALASVLGLIFLFGIFGFLVVYLISKCKDAYN